MNSLQGFSSASLPVLTPLWYSPAHLSPRVAPQPSGGTSALGWHLSPWVARVPSGGTSALRWHGCPPASNTPFPLPRERHETFKYLTHKINPHFSSLRNTLAPYHLQTRSQRLSLWLSRSKPSCYFLAPGFACDQHFPGLLNPSCPLLPVWKFKLVTNHTPK